MHKNNYSRNTGNKIKKSIFEFNGSLDTAGQRIHELERLTNKNSDEARKDKRINEHKRERETDSASVMYICYRYSRWRGQGKWGRCHIWRITMNFIKVTKDIKLEFQEPYKFHTVDYKWLKIIFRYRHE